MLTAYRTVMLVAVESRAVLHPNVGSVRYTGR